MTKETYIKITQPFRDRPEMAKGIHIANKICTGLMYLAYPMLLIYLIAAQEDSVPEAILVPAVSFVILSVGRALINRKRPYERFEILSVIPKDTKGKSFPSRHVFSATVISVIYICLFPWWWLGGLLLVITVGLAVVRVLSGVHYPSDVIAGMVCGIVFTLIGLAII